MLCSNCIFMWPFVLHLICCSMVSNILIGVFACCDHKHVDWLSHIAFCCGYVMLCAHSEWLYVLLVLSQRTCHAPRVTTLQSMASASPDMRPKCKVTLIMMDGAELAVKLCVTYLVHRRLHLFFRIAEDFIYGERDGIPPRLELTVIADNGDKVVLKEHLTPNESWDAQENRQYLMLGRQIPDMETTCHKQGR